MQLEIRVLFKVYQAFCLQSKYLEFRVSGWGAAEEWGIIASCGRWESNHFTVLGFFFPQTASHHFVLNIHSFQILGCGWLHGVICRLVMYATLWAHRAVPCQLHYINHHFSVSCPPQFEYNTMIKGLILKPDCLDLTPSFVTQWIFY